MSVVNISDEEAVKKVLVDSVLGLWDVVNNLTRIKPSRNDRYRVTIFGSARAKPGTIAYEETKRAAKELAAMGCDIITGGGPGDRIYVDPTSRVVGPEGSFDRHGPYYSEHLSSIPHTHASVVTDRLCE